MKKEEYITAFAEKHKTKFEKFADTDEEIAKFANGMFFDVLDIVWDIECELPTWAARDFHKEGTEGIVTESYIKWHESRKTQADERVYGG